MDLDERIGEAANEAVTRLALNGVEYESQYIHQDSERVTVHFVKGTFRFEVTIILGDHPVLFAQTSVEALTDQIADALREHEE
jgi:hypothetical protein